MDKKPGVCVHVRFLFFYKNPCPIMSCSGVNADLSPRYGRYPRQLPPFEVLQHSTATGGHKTDFFG